MRRLIALSLLFPATISSAAFAPIADAGNANSSSADRVDRLKKLLGHQRTQAESSGSTPSTSVSTSPKTGNAKSAKPVRKKLVRKTPNSAMPSMQRVNGSVASAPAAPQPPQVVIQPVPMVIPPLTRGPLTVQIARIFQTPSRMASLQILLKISSASGAPVEYGVTTESNTAFGGIGVIKSWRIYNDLGTACAVKNFSPIMNFNIKGSLFDLNRSSAEDRTFATKSPYSSTIIVVCNPLYLKSKVTIDLRFWYLDGKARRSENAWLPLDFRFEGVSFEESG